MGPKQGREYSDRGWVGLREKYTTVSFGGVESQVLFTYFCTIFTNILKVIRLEDDLLLQCQSKQGTGCEKTDPPINNFTL